MSFTICLHDGESRECVNATMERLKPLTEKYNVHWNNRIDRHPYAYDSYSEMNNEAIVTSPTERVILINDRAVPTCEDIEVMLQKLDDGFGWVSRYAWGLWAVDKELFRVVGMLDQNFIGAGNEDDDYVLRLRLADIAIYDSCESEYLYNKTISALRPKIGLKCSISGVYFWKKWNSYLDAMVKVLPEPRYPEWENLLGPRRRDISDKWMTFDKSVIGLGYGRLPQQGDSRTYHFRDKEGREFKQVIDLSKGKVV